LIDTEVDIIQIDDNKLSFVQYKNGYKSNQVGGFNSSSFLSSSFFAFFLVTLFYFFGFLNEAAFFSSKIFLAQSFQ
jgi:hypothetical protein